MGKRNKKFPYAFLILLLFSSIFPHFLPQISPLGTGGSPTKKGPGYATEHGQKEDHPKDELIESKPTAQPEKLRTLAKAGKFCMGYNSPAKWLRNRITLEFDRTVQDQ